MVVEVEFADQSIPNLPDLWMLHLRHRGLSQNLAGSYAEAASVCLTRYHTPPRIVRVSMADEMDTQYIADWHLPGPRLNDCYKNREDSVRDGAYSLSLAVVEARLGLVAVCRAEAKSGADYYIGEPGSEVNSFDGLLDLENSIRLEVSGIESVRHDGEWRTRLRSKVEQLRNGNVAGPGIAAVSVFSTCRVYLQKAI